MSVRNKLRLRNVWKECRKERASLGFFICGDAKELYVAIDNIEKAYSEYQKEPWFGQVRD